MIYGMMALPRHSRSLAIANPFLPGVLVMGIGSITFSLPHFLGGEYMVHDGSSASGAPGDDNICRAPKISHQSSANDLLDKLPGLDKIKSLTEGKERQKLAVGKS